MQQVHTQRRSYTLKPEELQELIQKGLGNLPLEKALYLHQLTQIEAVDLALARQLFENSSDPQETYREVINQWERGPLGYALDDAIYDCLKGPESVIVSPEELTSLALQQDGERSLFESAHQIYNAMLGAEYGSAQKINPFLAEELVRENPERAGLAADLHQLGLEEQRTYDTLRFLPDKAYEDFFTLAYVAAQTDRDPNVVADHFLKQYDPRRAAPKTNIRLREKEHD